MKIKILLLLVFVLMLVGCSPVDVPPGTILYDTPEAALQSGATSFPEEALDQAVLNSGIVIRPEEDFTIRALPSDQYGPEYARVQKVSLLNRSVSGQRPPERYILLPLDYGQEVEVESGTGIENLLPQDLGTNSIFAKLKSLPIGVFLSFLLGFVWAYKLRIWLIESQQRVVFTLTVPNIETPDREEIPSGTAAVTAYLRTDADSRRRYFNLGQETVKEQILTRLAPFITDEAKRTAVSYELRDTSHEYPYYDVDGHLRDVCEAASTQTVDWPETIGLEFGGLRWIKLNYSAAQEDARRRRIDAVRAAEARQIEAESQGTAVKNFNNASGIGNALFGGAIYAWLQKGLVSIGAREDIAGQVLEETVAEEE